MKISVFDRLISYGILAATFGINLLLAQPASALCAAAPEDGLWQNLNGNDPFQVEINEPNCEVPSNGSPPYSVTVWVKQSNGNLYNRGTYAGYRTNSRKYVYTRYGVGGYAYRQWMRRITDSNNAYLEVTILPESLDSKPNGPYEYYRFRRLR